MLIIKKSKIKNAGKGVFAKYFLPKGTYIGYYKGDYITPEQKYSLKNHQYVWQIKLGNEIYYIDGYKYKHNNPLRYVNGVKTLKQKRNTNVYAYQYDKKIHYKTLRDIEKGEELLIDYGDNYFI